MTQENSLKNFMREYLPTLDYDPAHNHRQALNDIFVAIKDAGYNHDLSTIHNTFHEIIRQRKKE